MLMVSSVKQLISKRQNKLSEQIQLLFLKRLHRLLSNGYPLLDALEAVAWDKELASLANRFIQFLKAGERFDKVFEDTGFHPQISSFLYFTRANSNLIESLRKCIDMFEHRLKNTKKFKQIIQYPIILMLVFSFVIFFINHHVLPAFHSLLHSASGAQQTIAVLIFIMDFMQYLVIIIIAGGVIFTTIWHFLKKSIDIDMQLRIFNRIPIYRNFLRLQNSFQLAIHFSALLKAGLSLKEILQELSYQTKLPITAFYAKLITNDLNRGFHMSSLLAELTFIEKQLAVIFQKNTDNQALEKDLSLYSEMLMEEIQETIVKTITFIQPVFYIILAIFIVFIYISLMWPMFQLLNTF